MGRSNACSVVIPVYARDDVFGIVPGVLGVRGVTTRLIVVDNGNADVLSARLRSLEGPRCHVIRMDENRGGSAAYIAGVEYAMREHMDTDCIWLLDDDAKPNADTLPGLLEAMETLVAGDPKTASVGSTVLKPQANGLIVECGATFWPIFGHAFSRLRGRHLADVGKRTLRVDFAAACSLLVRKKAIRECGFWEDVFIHFDDVEWGTRVTRMGWHNYATTTSTVEHPEFNPAKAGAWICYFDARNQYWLAAKYGWFYLLMARAKNLAKSVYASITGRMRAGNVYRKLAWSDYKQGIRRNRSELVEMVGLSG